jgi:guanylate kinase
MSQPPAHLPSARIKRRGLMLVISSPSGAGKSTIARNLLEHDTGLSLSVSVTTRPRRGSEIDGVHYQFKSHREFERMRDSEALLEWAEVHGNFYGTRRSRAGLAEMLPGVLRTPSGTMASSEMVARSFRSGRPPSRAIQPSVAGGRR